MVYLKHITCVPIWAVKAYIILLYPTLSCHHWAMNIIKDTVFINARPMNVNLGVDTCMCPTVRPSVVCVNVCMCVGVQGPITDNESTSLAVTGTVKHVNWKCSDYYNNIIIDCKLLFRFHFVSDDDNRIVLDPMPGVENCQDYINACYIDVCINFD